MARIGKRYLQAATALYANGTVPTKPYKRPPNNSPTEEVEQVKLVCWLVDNNIRHYSIPNGRGNVGENVRMNRMGQNAGVPDLCVPIPSGPHHSLYIELKRQKGGFVRPQQRAWLEWLNSQGHLAVVCRGFEEAKRTVQEYLGWEARTAS